MKDIKNFLIEAKSGFNINWESSDEYQWTPRAEWLSINVDENIFDWIEPKELDSWTEENGMDPEDRKRMLSMKPGEVYTPDGWNYYFRFKK